MSKELVHLSTCVHDHTAPNCDQPLLDLHIDVNAQSEVSIATITMEHQPDLFDCEPPVTMQCSPVSLDPHMCNHPRPVHSTHTHIMPQCTLQALCLLYPNWQIADLQTVTYRLYHHKINWNSKRATYIVKLQDLPSEHFSKICQHFFYILRALQILLTVPSEHFSKICQHFFYMTS